MIPFKCIAPFLPPELLEEFSRFMDTWPLDEIDVIAYAGCLVYYSVFSNSNYGIFEKKIAAWIGKNEIMMEELFWKTSNPRLQKLLADALPPNFYPTSTLKKHPVK